MGESSVHWERKVNGGPEQNKQEEAGADTLPHTQHEQRCYESISHGGRAMNSFRLAVIYKMLL